MRFFLLNKQIKNTCSVFALLQVLRGSGTGKDTGRHLVFTNSAGGPIDATGFYRRKFLGALKKAGIEKHTRFHDIRHGFASRLLAATGNDLAYVCDQLGHSSPNVTLSIYAHALKTQKQEIAEKVSQAFLVSGICLDLCQELLADGHHEQNRRF